MTKTNKIIGGTSEASDWTSSWCELYLIKFILTLNDGKKITLYGIKCGVKNRYPIETSPYSSLMGELMSTIDMKNIPNLKIRIIRHLAMYITKEGEEDEGLSSVCNEFRSVVSNQMLDPPTVFSIGLANKRQFPSKTIASETFKKLKVNFEKDKSMKLSDYIIKNAIYNEEAKWNDITKIQSAINYKNRNNVKFVGDRMRHPIPTNLKKGMRKMIRDVYDGHAEFVNRIGWEISATDEHNEWSMDGDDQNIDSGYTDISSPEDSVDNEPNFETRFWNVWKYYDLGKDNARKLVADLMAEIHKFPRASIDKANNATHLKPEDLYNANTAARKTYLRELTSSSSSPSTATEPRRIIYESLAQKNALTGLFEYFAQYIIFSVINEKSKHFSNFVSIRCGRDGLYKVLNNLSGKNGTDVKGEWDKITKENNDTFNLNLESTNYVNPGLLGYKELVVFELSDMNLRFICNDESADSIFKNVFRDINSYVEDFFLNLRNEPRDKVVVFPDMKLTRDDVRFINFAVKDVTTLGDMLDRIKNKEIRDKARSIILQSSSTSQHSDIINIPFSRQDSLIQNIYRYYECLDKYDTYFNINDFNGKKVFIWSGPYTHNMVFANLIDFRDYSVMRNDDKKDPCFMNSDSYVSLDYYDILENLKKGYITKFKINWVNTGKLSVVILARAILNQLESYPDLVEQIIREDNEGVNSRTEFKLNVTIFCVHIGALEHIAVNEVSDYFKLTARDIRNIFKDVNTASYKILNTYSDGSITKDVIDIMAPVPEKTVDQFAIFIDNFPSTREDIINTVMEKYKTLKGFYDMSHDDGFLYKLNSPKADIRIAKQQPEEFMFIPPGQFGKFKLDYTNYKVDGVRPGGFLSEQLETDLMRTDVKFTRE